MEIGKCLRFCHRYYFNVITDHFPKRYKVVKFKGLLDLAIQAADSSLLKWLFYGTSVIVTHTVVFYGACRVTFED